MKKKKLTSVALAAAMAIGTFGFSVPAKATEPTTTTTDYVLTIPATLNVKNAGWNATEGITANNSTHKFDTGKKLSVTATSEHDWKLVADGVTDTVGYNLATATGTYNSSAEVPSWEFSAAEMNEAVGTNKDMGIIVEDYSNKAAGNYTDTVTFTAKVESASTPVTAITINKTATTIQVGNSETLSVTAVTPDNATDQTVTWSSDKETVATVNATTGEVTAVAVGTANITATAGDGSGVTATCAVTVAPLYYDKAVQVYRSGSPEYSDYVYSGNYKTLSADEGYALAQYFASVNSCSVCVITDWINSNGQMKYVTNSSSAEQQSVPSFFGRYDRVYLVPKN